MSAALWILVALVAFLPVVPIPDLTQKRRAILRNSPVIGHLRYILEMFGPELRQYIVTGNDEERPFSRDQRRWVYASSKQENEYFGFGTDNDLELSPNYLIIRHSAFPIHSPHKGEPGFDPTYAIPCAKVLGGYPRRAQELRPTSILDTSAVSQAPPT